MKPALTRVLLVVALMTGSAEAGADSMPLPAWTYLTGDVFLDACNHDAANSGADLGRVGGCTGYVMGTLDAMLFAQSIGGTFGGWRTCIPVGVSAGQASDMVILYLKEHPRIRHLSAANIIAVAISEGFPCPKP